MSEELPESLRAEAAKRSCGDPDCYRPEHLIAAGMYCLTCRHPVRVSAPGTSYGGWVHTDARFDTHRIILTGIREVLALEAAEADVQAKAEELGQSDYGGEP